MIRSDRQAPGLSGKECFLSEEPHTHRATDQYPAGHSGKQSSDIFLPNEVAGTQLSEERLKAMDTLITVRKTENWIRRFFMELRGNICIELRKKSQRSS